MKLWLDDLRPIPNDYDIWCRTAAQAIWALENYIITHISFDNDLGTGFGEGYQVANYIEEKAHSGDLVPMTWNVHSANPVRRESIRKAMENADKFWELSRGRYERDERSNAQRLWFAKK